jgi:hypothetical protein
MYNTWNLRADLLIPYNNKKYEQLQGFVCPLVVPCSYKNPRRAFDRRHNY